MNSNILHIFPFSVFSFHQQAKKQNKKKTVWMHPRSKHWHIDWLHNHKILWWISSVLHTCCLSYHDFLCSETFLHILRTKRINKSLILNESTFSDLTKLSDQAETSHYLANDSNGVGFSEGFNLINVIFTDSREVSCWSDNFFSNRFMMSL